MAARPHRRPLPCCRPLFIRLPWGQDFENFCRMMVALQRKGRLGGMFDFDSCGGMTHMLAEVHVISLSLPINHQEVDMTHMLAEVHVMSLSLPINHQEVERSAPRAPRELHSTAQSGPGRLSGTRAVLFFSPRAPTQSRRSSPSASSATRCSARRRRSATRTMTKTPPRCAASSRNSAPPRSAISSR